jgi:hypothetical protein
MFLCFWECSTNAEALMGYSSWEIIILLLFSLAFKSKGTGPTDSVKYSNRSREHTIIRSHFILKEYVWYIR